ncbi:MAG: hypothetical protein K0S81_3524 [Rhodospirillales bacterium]|nr:hypothetical protein [Rhodospirillales bacterium]
MGARARSHGGPAQKMTIVNFPRARSVFVRQALRPPERTFAEGAHPIAGARRGTCCGELAKLSAFVVVGIAARGALLPQGYFFTLGGKFR